MEKLEYITQKALIKCSDGGAPGFFTPSYNTTVKINGCLVATAMDKIPMANIPTFVVCAKTQKPCVPAPTMWQDTYPVKVKGQQTLLGKSCMQCSIGGKMEFLTSGQIPLSAEEEAEVNGMRNDVQKTYEEEQKEANKPWWQKAGEFALDMVPIVGPVVSLAKNVSEGNFGMAALDVGFLALDVAGLVATPFTGGASLAASTAAKAGLRATVKGAAKAVAKKMSKEAVEAGVKQTGEMLAKLSVKNLTRGKLCVFACFVAGTPVAVKDGYRNIEDIQIGDEVWAWNETSEELELKPVIDLMQRESDHTITIFTEDEIIETTAEHPFLANGAWKNAADLITGDKISTKDKNVVEIKNTQFNYTSKKVFNFEVGDWHTYFVGILEILVHNNSQKCLTALMRELVEFTSKKYNIGNVVILLDKKGMKHILSRHHPKFWDGSVKATQTFLSKHLTVSDIKKGIGAVIEQNKEAILKNGTSRGQYKGIVDGIERTIGFKNGRIGQYY